MIIRDLNSHIQIFIASYLAAMLISAFSLCYLAIKTARSPFKTLLMILQSVTILWVLFLIFEWVSYTYDVLLSNIRVSLICLNFLAPLWLITMLFFTKRLSRRAPWLISAILIIPAMLSVVLLFPESSDIFKLYIRELNLNESARLYSLTWGPLESLTGVYSIVCVFLSFSFLIVYFRENSFIKRFEKTAFLLIMWSPLAAHYLAVYLHSPFDFKPMTFSLWGFITSYLSFQRQFFNVAPPLVWNIFDVTKESIAILGADGSVKVNNAFMVSFGACEQDLLTFTDGLSAELSGCIRQKKETDGLEAEKDGIYYRVTVRNVLHGKKRVIDQLVTISDVSATKLLTLANERERIASNLYDSMGNQLIASLNNLNLALRKPNLEGARPYVDFAATSTTASLMMLRKIDEGLIPVNFNEARFISLIESVVDRISASGINVDLVISGELENLPVQIKEFIYNTCQEALTNTVIHGRAENIIIKLKYMPYSLWLNILDDGRGCKEISKNHGLTAMENRAERLGGRIDFGSPSFGGFGIYAQLPVKGD